MMNKKIVSFLITILLWTYSTEVLHAQYGFDIAYSLNPQPGLSVYSPLFTIMTDSQRIFVAGLGHQDTTGGNTPPGTASFIASFDYNGNFQWKKTLSFSSPRFKRNIPLGYHLLSKVRTGKYVLGAMGVDCTDSIIACDSRPFLYFFKSNGDSLRFVYVPFDNDHKRVFIPRSTAIDKQYNVLLAGTYRNDAIGDTAGIWLAKFDSAGNFSWRKPFLDTPFLQTQAECYKVILGNTPNRYILGGVAIDPDTVHNSAYALWKTDTAGNVLWRRNIPKFTGWASDEFYGNYGLDIINARNGSGYYFATTGAKKVQFPNEPPSYRTVFYCGKLNEDGHVLWAKTYERDTLHADGSYGIVQQPNGDLLIMGQSAGYVAQTEASSGSVLFCTDSSGHVKWLKLNKKYECPSQVIHQLNSMGLSPDGKVVRGGSIGQMYQQPSCYDTADYIAWLVVTDSLGRRFANDTLTLPLQEEVATFPGDTTLSVDEQKSDLPQINIYPNPTKDKVYIAITYLKGNATMVKALLYDYTGRVIKTQKFKTASEPIDLKGYNPGLYILKLRYENQDVGTWKLIKQ